MKSVLVTGGTVRLGRLLSGRLSAAGWKVVTSSHRSGSGADIVADLSQSGAADSLFYACRDILGGSAPDALVNNAALFRGTAEELEAVDLAAPARLVELMARESAGDGKVRSALCIADADALGPSSPGDTPYISAKRRLVESAVAAAKRHAGFLRVNVVAPGPVLVPTCGGVKASPAPFGRPAPDDVADAVLFLLSARCTTGAVIRVG